jgi:diadenosine tetraphosphate (Ap4A) HIT family hydrolase
MGQEPMMDAFRVMLDEAPESIAIPESLRQRRVAVVFIALDQAGRSVEAGAATGFPGVVGGGRCPFCSLPPERIVQTTERIRVVRDAFPVSPGHTLLIPRRHVASLFGLTVVEWVELGQLLVRARTALLDEFQPDGFNIGINDGPAAGQTVSHLHVHLIPRYRGDQPDPRGGVRWIFPDKARYWP